MSMRQGQTAVQGLKFFCLIAVIGMLVSCETSGGGGDACAGFESLVSCIEVSSITPQNSNGDTSSDVDALQDDCDPDAQVFEPEPFTAHNAQITFTNTFLPTADGGYDVRLSSYSVTYRLTDCPANATGCPPLRGFSEAQTITIPAESDVTVTVSFVPLRVKNDYVAAGGELGLAAPGYVAHYVFTGATVPFAADLTVEADVAFRITDFNLCN